jgi:hypothetical protein
MCPLHNRNVEVLRVDFCGLEFDAMKVPLAPSLTGTVIEADLLDVADSPKHEGVWLDHRPIPTLPSVLNMLYRC